MTGVRGPVGLEELYAEHYRSLVRLAALLVDDVGTCEELVQDAFVGVLRRRSAWDDPARAAAYLRSAVLNGARSALRKRRVRERPVPAPVRSGEADDNRHVLAALRSLPDRQREVLAMRYWLDLSEADIASTLGISAGSVKTHASRGLAALERVLEEER